MAVSDLALEPAEFVRRAVAAAQAIAPDLGFSDGSPEFALVVAAILSGASFNQFLSLEVLKQTRLATCEGDDVDSYIEGQFGLARLPGKAATGLVTFSRVNATLATLIPPGTLVKTSDGSQVFQVIEDYANPAWSFEQNGYVLGASIVSLQVPVECLKVGSQGNVKAGTLTQRASAIIAVDSVTNASAFTNGLDAESDDAYKARFAHWFTTRSEGTPDALAAAVESVQQGLTYVINENYDLTGEPKAGMVSVFVDDGSGATSAAILQKANTALNKARACGVVVGIGAATKITANVVMTVTAQDGYEKAALMSPISVAVAAHINSLAVGEPLSYHKLSQVAQNATPGIARIDGLLLNGGTANILADRYTGKVIRAGTVTVS